MATDKNVAELEDDFEIEVEDDTPEEDQGREPMPEEIVKELDNDDELENFSKEKAKQLKKVWHDERRAKEAALREREEAVGLLRCQAHLLPGPHYAIQDVANADQADGWGSAHAYASRNAQALAAAEGRGAQAAHHNAEAAGCGARRP